jgi:medium-chain acyl-[acyl-carrier-protein] hydrolase
MPAVRFAAVPTWGTNASDLAALRERPNIAILEPADNIDEILRQTRILLVPSVWAEARSRIVVEAMARGVPVIASDIGGIPEAKLGVPYLIPVNPIVRYKPAVDENMAPVPEVPEQDIEPWQAALERLLTDRAHYEQLSQASRAVALEYARHLSVQPFEQFLEHILRSPERRARPAPAVSTLSPEKRRLLALRLHQKSWLPYIDAQSDKPRLFCFPYAGAGALAYRPWIAPLSPAVSVCPIRLPGRETRINEEPLDSIAALVKALEAAITPYLDRPFAFFGHSMGGAIAFELARSLRRHGRTLPTALYVSAARAPQFRLNWTPPPPPNDLELLEQLRDLDGVPSEVLENSRVIQYAFPVLRADTALFRNYVYVPEPPLPIPIFAYGGRSDPNVSPEHLEAWREQTTFAFVRREFEGGHFFIHSASEEFLWALLKDASLPAA